MKKKRHLEREMELNGLEFEETRVETQMTITKKPEDKTTQPKNSTPKKEQHTPKTVPINKRGCGAQSERLPGIGQTPQDGRRHECRPIYAL